MDYSTLTIQDKQALYKKVRSAYDEVESDNIYIISYMTGIQLKICMMLLNQHGLYFSSRYMAYVGFVEYLKTKVEYDTWFDMVTYIDSLDLGIQLEELFKEGDMIC